MSFCELEQQSLLFSDSSLIFVQCSEADRGSSTEGVRPKDKDSDPRGTLLPKIGGIIAATRPLRG
jgi:hypothetical protein